MKLPQQTMPVERKTYNANAVTRGANSSFSFWGTLGDIAKGAVSALPALLSKRPDKAGSQESANQDANESERTDSAEPGAK